MFVVFILKTIDRTVIFIMFLNCHQMQNLIYYLWTVVFIKAVEDAG